MKVLASTAAVAGALLLVPQAAAAAQPAPVPALQTAEQAARAFLQAFDALDRAAFDAFFAEEVTIFFPNGSFPRDRVRGRAGVIEVFHRLFDAVRARRATRLGIEPLDLQVQDYGNFAVASFHLRGNGNIGRRSMVMRRDAGRWRIVHFHASSLEQNR